MMLRVVGPVGPTGYGVVTSHLTWAMEAIGQPVCLMPIGPMDTSWFTPKVARACKTATEQSAGLGADATLCIWHEWDHPPTMIKVHLPTEKYVAMPTFELDRVSDRAIEALSKCWRVLVTSKWAAKILESQGLKNVQSVAFHGVDTDTFEPGLKTPIVTGSMNILSIGKMEVRKGHDICVLTLAEMLRQGMKVSLITMWYNAFMTRNGQLELMDKWITDAASKSGVDRTRIMASIHHISPKPRPAQVAMLMNNADVGLFPYRAEGWNLPLLEMMACGKHVVATNHTGPTEYLTEDNAHLIRGYAANANDNIWFGPGRLEGQWVEPDVLQTMTTMEDLYRRWEQGSLGTNDAAVKTAEEFTWFKAAKRVQSWLG